MPKRTKLDDFRDECEYWLKELGLSHIQVDYKRGCSKNAFAECLVDPETFTATISLTKRISRQINLTRLALHEVLHICLWPLDGDIEKEHEIVNRLIKIIYKDGQK